MSARLIIGALLCGLALSGPALAQATDPKACAPGERMVQGADGPKAPTTTGENLSDKLARTDGVICPPNVDPGIKLPTPDAGRTPVIPPPGSPGGDQTVRPK